MTDTTRHRPLPVRTLLALSLGLASAGLTGQTPGPIASEPFALANGLTVTIVPDPSTQVVAIDLWVEAGSREEPAGKQGLARLFERLMAAGSAAAPQGAYAALIEGAGGTSDAEVDAEFARFRQVLPSNHLELGLWLEADRLRSLVINDTTVAASRTALLEDLSQTLGREPYALALERTVASMYDSTVCPGYSHPASGSVQAILNLSAADARNFFRTRYTPNRAHLVLAGDVEPARARALVERYFGDLTRGPDSTPPGCTMRTPGAARRVTVADRSAREPAAALLFPIPDHAHPDAPALELLGTILGQGGGSRLGQSLVRQAGSALAVRAGVLGDRRASNVFVLFAVAGPGTGVDSLATRLAAEAVWASSDSLGEADLARARQAYLAALVSGRERPGDIAEAVAHAVAFHHRAEAINLEPQAVLAVTLADLRRVARTWLEPAQAVTLIMTPGAAS